MIKSLRCHLLYILYFPTILPILVLGVWPPRLLEFGAPIFIALLLAISVFALLTLWLERHSAFAELVQRQLKLSLIISLATFANSLLLVLSNYLISRGLYVRFLASASEYIHLALVWLLFLWTATCCVLIAANWLGDGREQK